MSDLVPVRRALISVSDKTGLEPFATALVKEFNVELISTGGTSKFLRDAGLKVTDVSDVTGFPEMMDGRVKTLHPLIHGGLLALRDNAEHVAAMNAHGIKPIDLVCINLYPFQQTIAKPGVAFDEAIENIDIGGPSMIRSAAKNHRFVLVVTSADRYEKVLGDLRQHRGSSCGTHRLKMAQAAFSHTGEYDTGISEYLFEQIENAPPQQTGGGTVWFENAPHSGRVATAAPAMEGRGAREPQAQSSVDVPTRNFNLEAMEDLIQAQSVAARGTEAIAMKILRDLDGEYLFEVLAHLRPDNASAAVRERAIEAFKKIAGPCIEQRKNGVFEIGPPDESNETQYCLVTLLGQEAISFAVTCVVMRCKDVRRAQMHLSDLEHIVRSMPIDRPAAVAIASASEDGLAKLASLRLSRVSTLRYGENPHQQAALYIDDLADTEGPNISHATQLHGKELSYINLLDADAALACVAEFEQPAACIVKHATPCGVAVGSDLATAFDRAYASDSLAAFGGIVAVNRDVSLDAAQRIVEGKKFLEVIVAPSYARAALELLQSRWKNLRILTAGSGAGARMPADGTAWLDRSMKSVTMHKVVGGHLVQERDVVGIVESEWKVASNRQPTAQELADLKFAWLACKHVKSNAIVLAKDGATVGIGGGQVDRVGAARIAIGKAADRARGSVVASDAFFPFPDGPQWLLDAGVTAIIQPGGSQKDHLTIDAVDAAGATMIFTGRRHFKH